MEARQGRNAAGGSMRKRNSTTVERRDAQVGAENGMHWEIVVSVIRESAGVSPPGIRPRARMAKRPAAAPLSAAPLP